MELIDKGRKNVERFNWNDSALKLLELNRGELKGSVTIEHVIELAKQMNNK